MTVIIIRKRDGSEYIFDGVGNYSIPFISDVSNYGVPQGKLNFTNLPDASGRKFGQSTVSLNGSILINNSISYDVGQQQSFLRDLFTKCYSIALSGSNTYHTFDNVSLASLEFSDNNLAYYMDYNANFNWWGGVGSILSYSLSENLSENTDFVAYSGTTPLSFSTYYKLGTYNISITQTAQSSHADSAREFVQLQDIDTHRYYTLPTNSALINKTFTFSSDINNGTYTKTFSADVVPVGTKFIAKTEITKNSPRMGDTSCSINVNWRGEYDTRHQKYEFGKKMASGVLGVSLSNLILVSNSESYFNINDFYSGSFSLEYKKSRIPSSEYLLDYDVNVTYVHPGNVFSITPIIGRDSPILQTALAKTAKRTRVDITLFPSSGVHDFNSDLRNFVNNNILAAYRPSNDPSQYKVSPPSITTDKTKNTISYSIEYISAN